MPRPASASLPALSLLSVLCACPPGGGDDAGVGRTYPLDDVLRVHHAQVLGTHNSYHMLSDVDADPWRYEHLPIGRQLDEQGVRALELDVSRDDESGLYRVFHLALVDERTTCPTFADCLREIATWSRAHRGHAPIFVQIETKDEESTDDLEGYLTDLEAIVEEELDAALLLAPDLVRGAHDTLAAAIAADGWPTLGAARGRTLLFLDGARAAATYRELRPELEAAVFFTREAAPSSTFVLAKLDDAKRDAAAIGEHARAARLVRTRADADGAEARADDHSTAEAAFASGAHIVSTDFPAPFLDLPYFVEVPDGTPARCNPITAPPECTSEAIEDPELLEQ